MATTQTRKRPPIPGTTQATSLSATTSSSHNVPADEPASEEAPPPYSEIAEEGTTVIDVNTRPMFVEPGQSSNSASSAAPSLPTRPTANLSPGSVARPPRNTSTNPANNSSASSPSMPQRPAARPPASPNSQSRPANRPTSSSSSNGYLRPQHTSASSASVGSNSSSYSKHSGHSSHSSHSNYSSSSSSYNQQSYRPNGYGQGNAGYRPNYGPGPGPGPNYMPNAPPQQYNQPRPQLNYPAGYYCPKCNNTGLKPSGRTCKDCYSMFAQQNNVHYIPPNLQPVFTAPPRVVTPGHPSIGGVLCGRCRGTGVVHDMVIFESTCPVCGGIGRLI